MAYKAQTAATQTANKKAKAERHAKRMENQGKRITRGRTRFMRRRNERTANSQQIAGDSAL